MTERLGTQDIYKYVMSAPPAEPLTLPPVDLMLLREWLKCTNDNFTKMSYMFSQTSEKNEKLNTELAVTIDQWRDASAMIDELRAELAAVKPSWDDAPEWAEFRARDENGAIWYFEKPPYSRTALDGGIWQSGPGKGRSDLYEWGNWRDTLERRREVE